MLVGVHYTITYCRKICGHCSVNMPLNSHNKQHAHVLMN